MVGRHLTAMVEVVTAHGGVLDKFAGDAVMAVFGAPRPAPDHARRALECAAAMQRRQLALNDAAEHTGLPAFQIGIGINTGTVIAGTLGGPGRLDYTVLGDAVNIAQRLAEQGGQRRVLAAAVTEPASGHGPGGASRPQATQGTPRAGRGLPHPVVGRAYRTATGRDRIRRMIQCQAAEEVRARLPSPPMTRSR